MPERAAEQAKKQAEIDQKREKAVAEAEAQSQRGGSQGTISRRRDSKDKPIGNLTMAQLVGLIVTQ